MDILDFSSSDPLILITNDDGIESPGLHAAVEAVMGLGQLLVAAPTRQQTARGRSMIGDPSDYFHPTTISAGGTDVPAFHINASPALVVRHAVAVLTPGRTPDIVVSGINYGENLGSNITISGTVGAAFQAAAQGIPAIAVSRQTDIEHHFEYGDLDWEEPIRVTRGYAQRMLELTATASERRRCPFDLLKIDVPHDAPPGTEERVTRLSRQRYYHSVVPNPRVDSPISESVTSVHADFAKLSPDDDIYAVAVDGVVSVTPLIHELTASLSETAALLRRTSVQS